MHKDDPTPQIHDEFGLTYTKAVFARAYVTAMIANGNKRPNARECAIAAGSKPSAANQMASLWLKDEAVAASIRQQMEDHMAAFDITAERILKEIAAMAFSTISDYMTSDGNGGFFVDLSQLTPEQAKALAEITVDEYQEGRGESAREVKKIRFKLHDKARALELLGKWKKMWTDKTELTGADGKPLSAATVEMHVHFMESDGNGRPKEEG
jgi:phage terminase small subunit